jgi:hypothetical protein
MASEAQILANRANAQKSTGPRTPEGKAVVAQNAVTHGFLAQETVIRGEDAGEFAVHRDRMLRDLAPVGDGELDMAERIAGLSWRLRRAERLQTEAFEELYERMAAGTPGGGTPVEGVTESTAEAAGGAGSGTDRLLGRMLVEDFSNARVLDKLLLYERRIENSLFRTTRELREQKRMRLAGGPAEAIGGLAAGATRGTGLLSASLSEPALSLPKGQGLPVVQMHGRDAHATRPPDGVTANLLSAQGTLFKTNPICAGAHESAVFEAEKGGSASGPGGLEETKPIPRGDSSASPAVRRVA